jgi:hypothetical protein
MSELKKFMVKKGLWSDGKEGKPANTGRPVTWKSKGEALDEKQEEEGTKGSLKHMKGGKPAKFTKAHEMKDSSAEYC